MKQHAAEEIAKRVKDGVLLGIGTGSTVDLAIDAIGQRIRKEGLKISCITSSAESANRCSAAGLTVISSIIDAFPDWGFDGADEVDPNLNLIKGGGAALLQEKILAKKCKKFFIIVDESKLVAQLGERFPVPVEVIPESIQIVKSELAKLGALETVVRTGSGKYGAVVTEKGNNILDVRFKEIPNTLERDIKTIVGVVESGLFFNYTKEVIVGQKSGIKILK